MKKKLISIAIPFACYFLFLNTNPLYFSTDSMEVAIVTNGLYGSDNYCQYVHPLLCVMIRFLSGLLPHADCFTLLMHIVILIVFATLLFMFEGKWNRKNTEHRALSDYLFAVFTLLAIFFSTFGLHIWNANYTIQTAYITFAGLLTLFVSIAQDSSAKWIWPGTVLTCFGFMVRQEAALLFIPFIALESIGILTDRNMYTRIHIRKRAIKETIQYLLPAASIILLLLVSQKIMYSSEPEKSASRYNAARTTVVDYPMKSWSEDLVRNEKAGENQEEKPGQEIPLFKEDYIAAGKWLLADTEIMTMERLEAIAQAGRKDQYALSLYGFFSVLKEMKSMMFQKNIYFLSLVMITLILIVRNVFVCTSPWAKAEAIFTFLGSFSVLAYFTFRGRAPMRVWEPVIFAADFVLISSAMRDKCRATGTENTMSSYPANEPGTISQSNTGNTESKTRTRSGTIVNAVFLLVIFCILWYCTGQIIKEMHLRSPQNVLTANDSSADELFRDTLDKGDRLYIWENFEANILFEYMKAGKLPSYQVLSHNIALGDWTYGQTYYTAFLDQIRHPNPIRDLVEKPNVYIMSDDSYILDFLCIHYGDDISLFEAGRIGDRTAYQVKRITSK